MILCRSSVRALPTALLCLLTIAPCAPLAARGQGVPPRGRPLLIPAPATVHVQGAQSLPLVRDSAPAAPHVAIPGLPSLQRRGAITQLIVDGEPFLVLNSETDNSSGSSLAFMEGSFRKLNALHANTAVVALSWELIEPQEGQFDLSLVDGLIAGARRHHLRLIFLWFGTWKNTFSSYTPPWVKTDRARFPRSEPNPGQDWGAISCFSQNARQADARAFAAVMRRIREIDRREHTVLMMQVENETGQIGSQRDHSAFAEKAFGHQVPDELTTYLSAHEATLIPELKQAWANAGKRTTGTWRELFGDAADEVFMAWHTARYVDAVVAAGKAEYPIPMFVNAWLEGSPGSYPSGGPVSRMMDVWRAAAPHIDLFAPDIYGDTEKFDQVCALYSRSANPLMVVESSPDAAPANAFSAIAKHNAIGFGPYPLEDPFGTTRLGEVYACIDGMMPLITRYQGTGRLAGILLHGDQPQDFSLGTCRIHVAPFTARTESSSSGDGNPQAARLPGHGLILAADAGEYFIVGEGFSVEFQPGQGRSHVEVLTMDEGRFEKGVWVRGRRLNGDEWEGALKLGGVEPGYTHKRQGLQIRRVTLSVR